jgi:L-amino acid N-acyltransferase YncA
MASRDATPADATEIAAIYNEGIADRTATFETRERSTAEVVAWFDGRHPLIVVERGDRIVGFATTTAYRPRDCYAGIAEFGVYVSRAHRGTGVGREAMEALAAAAERAGFWKLVSRVFVSNVASRSLLRSVGFREVGTYRRHAKLEGAWIDVVIVERLFGEAALDA